MARRRSREIAPSPQTAHSLIESATTIADKCGSKAARALRVEATVDGVDVWHIRYGFKQVHGSLPMPHELSTLAEARKCAEVGESIAAQHSTVDRSMALAGSLFFAVVIVGTADVFVATVGSAVFSGVGAVVFKAAVWAFVAAMVVTIYSIESDPPEVWTRRTDAYRRRVEELQGVTADAAAPPTLVVVPARRRRWWWPRQV